ncbi:dihydrofolate reductase family protein [Agromyces sp. NPDC004153]
MGKVIANASMSLDGFVAFEDDDIGELFEWYDNGEVEIVNEGELPPFHVTRPSADYWRSWVDGLGVLVVGRELFDLTDGWHGRHPIGVPIVVLTHEPPHDWSYPGSEDFTFVTEGIAAAVERAKLIAGSDHDVGLTGGTIAGQALEAGLVDEVAVDLVPVVMGSGKRFFGDTAPVRLGDATTVIEGRRVLHLRFPVERVGPAE